MIRVSVEGQDATQVPDWQALFSSNYPLLKIAYQGNFTVNFADLSPQVIVSHNLGYFPFFLVYVDWGDYTTDPGFAGLSGLATDGANAVFRINSSQLWADTSIFARTDTMRCRYMVFHQDLNEQYDFSNLATSTKPYGNLNNFGLKVTPPGFDAATESDFRNFSLHTATRSLPLHMVRKYTAVGTPSPPYVFAHGLGYPPFTLYWQKHSTNAYWQLFGSGANDSFMVTTDTANVTHAGYDAGGGTEYTIMVFKDPYDLS